MLINNGSNQNVEIPFGFLINDSGPFIIVLVIEKLFPVICILCM